MELGQRVASDLYTEYGIGTIISKNKIFDKEHKEKILRSGDRKNIRIKVRSE
jgi:hypothetical protein